MISLRTVSAVVVSGAAPHAPTASASTATSAAPSLPLIGSSPGSGDEFLEARQVHGPAAGGDDDMRVRGRLHLAGKERGSGGGAGGLDEQLRALPDGGAAAREPRGGDQADVVADPARVRQRRGP